MVIVLDNVLIVPNNRLLFQQWSIVFFVQVILLSIVLLLSGFFHCYSLATEFIVLSLSGFFHYSLVMESIIFLLSGFFHCPLVIGLLLSPFCPSFFIVSHS